MPYEQIENITRADVAFRISGIDLYELFCSGAEALLSVLIENPHSLLFKEERHIRFENNIDLLLYDFLQEIIFYKDSESLLLLPKTISFANTNNITRLDCILHGEYIDTKKHKSNTDVKAVTLHNLKIENPGNQWIGEFVLDV
jgi:SHS2 domain-containing protein